jgi:hypothetical protein
MFIVIIFNLLLMAIGIVGIGSFIIYMIGARKEYDAFLFMVSFVPLAFGLASVYALYLMYFS